MVSDQHTTCVDIWYSITLLHNSIVSCSGDSTLRIWGRDNQGNEGGIVWRCVQEKEWILISVSIAVDHMATEYIVGSGPLTSIVALSPGMWDTDTHTSHSQTHTHTHTNKDNTDRQTQAWVSTDTSMSEHRHKHECVQTQAWVHSRTHTHTHYPYRYSEVQLIYFSIVVHYTLFISPGLHVVHFVVEFIFGTSTPLPHHHHHYAFS